MANLKRYVHKIERWSHDRGLDNQDPKRQLLKLYEEFGELSEGISKNNVTLIKDSIGDVFVVSVILAQQLNLSLADTHKIETAHFKMDTIELALINFVNLIATLSIAVEAEELTESLIGLVPISLEYICRDLNIKLTDCVGMAYAEIKDRKGKLVNGTFIKQSDLT